MVKVLNQDLRKYLNKKTKQALIDDILNLHKSNKKVLTPKCFPILIVKSGIYFVRKEPRKENAILEIPKYTAYFTFIFF